MCSHNVAAGRVGSPSVTKDAIRQVLYPPIWRRIGRVACFLDHDPNWLFCIRNLPCVTQERAPLAARSAASDRAYAGQSEFKCADLRGFTQEAEAADTDS
jgi:hypothetical protein